MHGANLTAMRSPLPSSCRWRRCLTTNSCSPLLNNWSRLPILSNAANLEKLREVVVLIQEQQQATQQNTAAQAQEILQAVLEAPDAAAAIREHADLIDENFLGLLAASVQRAEQNKAAAAARRLRKIYDLAMEVMQEQMSPDLRLINDLLNAADQGARRKLLEENRSLLSRDFLEALKQLEEDFRQRQGADVADRLKSIRGQAALML